MTKKCRIIVRLLASLLIVFTFGKAWGDDQGNAILQKVDATLMAPQDEESNMKMILIDKTGDRKERNLKSYTKYFNDKDDWRVIKFLTPTDVRGIGFLVLADDQMYLYMPAFHRIRRIASHSKKESFMGSDLSYNDMETSRYFENYNANLIEDTQDNYILELTRRPTSKKPYPRIKMTVDKISSIPISMEYFNEANNLWKIWKMELQKVGRYYTQSKIEVEDKKKAHRTIIERENIKFDQGLKDKIFTQRFLKRRPK